MEDNNLYEVPTEETSDRGTCARALYDYQAGELVIYISMYVFLKDFLNPQPPVNALIVSHRGAKCIWEYISTRQKSICSLLQCWDVADPCTQRVVTRGIKNYKCLENQRALSTKFYPNIVEHCDAFNGASVIVVLVSDLNLILNMNHKKIIHVIESILIYLGLLRTIRKE